MARAASAEGVYGSGYGSVENVRDGNNRVIGMLIDLGSQVIAKGPYGELYGTYQRLSDLTWDVKGRLVGEGNQLLRFFPQ